MVRLRFVDVELLGLLFALLGLLTRSVEPGRGWPVGWPVGFLDGLLAGREMATWVGT